MKKSVRSLVISLAPAAIIIVYSFFQSLADNYSGRYYDTLPSLITGIAGYVLIGVTIFIIIKITLKNEDITRIPFEYLIGAILVVFPILYYFIPIVIPFFNFIYRYGLGLSCLFIGIYISLFVVLFRRRAKALKARTADQNN